LVKKLWRHENFKRSWTLHCQFMGGIEISPMLLARPDEVIE
jgi:hypothetical protein